MRTHSQIVTDATTAKLVEVTGCKYQTVKSWEVRNSIPAEHWQALIDSELAAADELIAAAATRAA